MANMIKTILILPARHVIADIANLDIKSIWAILIVIPRFQTMPSSIRSHSLSRYKFALLFKKRGLLLYFCVLQS